MLDTLLQVVYIRGMKQTTTKGSEMERRSIKSPNGIRTQHTLDVTSGEWVFTEGDPGFSGDFYRRREPYPPTI